MNSRVLLDRLLKIQRNTKIASDKEFNSLLNDVKIEVSNIDKLKATKIALDFLNSVETDPFVRCLRYTDIQNIGGIDYQVFTDNIVGFYLEDHYCLPSKKDFEKTYSRSYSFPIMSEVLPFENEEVVLEDIKGILYKLSNNLYDNVDMPIKVLNSKNYSCSVDARYLKLIVDILNTDDITIYLQGKFSPMLIVDNGSNSKATLLPLRKWSV